MDPLPRRRATLPAETHASTAVQLASPERPEAGATPRISTRPEALPMAGRSRSRLIFKERFKERLSEPEGPGAEHARAQDLSLYRAQLGDAIAIGTVPAPRRLKKALIALHRLHGASEPSLPLPVFIHALLMETRTASVQPSAWQQIRPGITPADAFLSLVLGTQQLTASTCSASDVEAINGSLHVIERGIDPQQAADVASHDDLAYFITLIAKNAGPLVSRLFLDAEVVPLDRHPTRFCPNTKHLTRVAIEQGSPAFGRELALTNIKQDNLFSIIYLRKMLAVPNCGVDVIKKFAEAGYDLIGLRFESHATALHVAAQYNDPAVVAYLLSLRGPRRAKLDINAKDATGTDALCLAAGNLQHGAAIASLLLERGARMTQDETTLHHPAHYMVDEKNAAGLQAIFDGLTRRQREQLIGGQSSGRMPLIVYAAQHGSAEIVDAILRTCPAQAQTLKVHFRHLFEIVIKEVTKGTDPVEALQEVLDNIPPSLLRELDQNFSFHRQASTLPASQAVLDCLVEYNRRTVRAGGEPVFASEATIDQRSQLLGLFMSNLDEEKRGTIIAGLSTEGFDAVATGGIAGDARAGFLSQMLSSLSQTIAEKRTLAEANDPEYVAALDEALAKVGLSLAPVVSGPPPRGPESPGPSAA